MKKNKIVAIMLIILSCALLVSVCITVIALRKSGSGRIMDVYDIGLGGLMNSEIQEMYLDEGSNPDLKGELYDENVLKDIREVLLNGCYQSAPEPVKDLAPGSDVSPFIRLKTADAVYSIAVKGGVLSVTAGGETKYYYTNISHRISGIINEAAIREFAR